MPLQQQGKVRQPEAVSAIARDCQSAGDGSATLVKRKRHRRAVGSGSGSGGVGGSNVSDVTISSVISGESSSDLTQANSGKASSDEGYLAIDMADNGRQSGLQERATRLAISCFVAHYPLWLPGVVLTVAFLLWTRRLRLLAAIAIPYAPFYLRPSHLLGDRAWPAFITAPFWHHVQRLLSIKVVRTAALDPARRYVFGFHPHGILVLSRLATYGGLWQTLFPGVEARTLAATPMFLIPCIRELCLWLGAMDARRAAATRALRRGLSLIIYPGGTLEIFQTDNVSTETRLVLKRRLGFVRLAARAGASLVPVYVFGEKWAYSRADLPSFLVRPALKYLKFPVIAFWGRWGTYMPRPVRLGVVYGRPIHVEQSEEPSQDQLEKVLEQYCTALRELFDAHKAEFGYGPEETLVIE